MPVRARWQQSLTGAYEEPPAMPVGSFAIRRIRQAIPDPGCTLQWGDRTALQGRWQEMPLVTPALLSRGTSSGIPVKHIETVEYGKITLVPCDV